MQKRLTISMLRPFYSLLNKQYRLVKIILKQANQYHIHFVKINNNSCTFHFNITLTENVA